MIKYNDNTINKWYHDGELIKVYYHDAVCYYKLTPSGQTPCFAVVADISQYSDTEFIDVFNQADGKWYKLNNLSTYEEYGVYGSGRNITTYEGKLTIDGDYEYQYSGSSWVNVGEISGSTATLPDVAFVLNYNAKTYSSSTQSMSYTDGQLNTVNAVRQYGAAVVDHSEDGYISVTGDTRFVTTGGTVGIGRNNTQTGCTMTIVSKARATSGEAVLTSRGGTSGSQMNWMWRYRTDGIFLHGSSSYNTKKYSVDTTVSPIIASVKTYYDGGVKQILKDWTNDGGYSGNFGYGGYYDGGSMFCDYLTFNNEFWQGDFYWVYMSQEVLTDDQIQQVIAYNESGGQTEYPVYYDEIQDPPNYLSFSSMTEAEDYQCPWVGMKATIDGDKYVFSGDSQSGYEWVEVILPYTELQWIEMPQTSPYCAVQLVDSYSGTSYLYYDFELLFNTLQDVRIIGFDSYAYMVGYGGSSIYLQLSRDTAQFNVSNQFTSGVKYHFGLGKRNSTSNNTFDNLDASTTYATFNTSLLKTKKPYFGAINQGSSLLVNGESERIYSIKVYDNEVLVGNYIPVKRNSDNFVTLYDTVSEQFCDTVGGGTMIAGPTV